jgi:hypothetical protein
VIAGCTVHPVRLGELASLRALTSKIQDEKRKALSGTPSRWPDRLTAEFSALEEHSLEIPYAALDLQYLRDTRERNRPFGYVVTYDTFVAPPRNTFGKPDGEPQLRSVVKLGDGGQERGYGAGRASGSVISRVVWSYWEAPNTYSGVLQGVVIPGRDRNISNKIASSVGGRELQIKGDVWDQALLKRLPVDELLELLRCEQPPAPTDRGQRRR